MSENSEKIRKYKAEIKELLEYKKKIQKIFKAKTLKTAIKHFNELKEKLDKLTEVIGDFIKKLNKKLDLVLEQVKDRKIPKTNNLVKLFFKVTFPGKIKRIYRTYEEALNKIKLDNLRWIEKNMIEYHKKKINQSVEFFTVTTPKKDLTKNQLKSIKGKLKP